MPSKDTLTEDRRLGPVTDQPAQAAETAPGQGDGADSTGLSHTDPAAADECLSETELRHWAEVYARDESALAETGAASAHVIFQVGGERFAVPLDDLDEVARVEVGIGLSHASALVLGLVNIRGEVVPMLDTAAALGTRGTYRLGNANRTLVVRDAKERRTALPVDRIESIDLLQPELFQLEASSAEAGGEAHVLIRRIGVGEYAGGSLTLLDLRGLRRAGSDNTGDDSF